MIEAAMKAPASHALKSDKKNMKYVLKQMEEFGLETYTLPGQKIDEIFRDYRGKLVVLTRVVPRNLERLYAEFERKDPVVAKAWLRAFQQSVDMKGDING
jgi:hypothetical protein